MTDVYEATVEWRAGEGEAFTTRRYKRAFSWQFDGGAEVAGSAAPAVVPPPLSDPAGVDPEEALVAAIAGCHMLFFLDLASRKGLDIAAYTDKASGIMAKREDGRTAMVSATLRPRVAFVGAADPELVSQLHHRAHELCYIANSVNFPVAVEPVE